MKLTKSELLMASAALAWGFSYVFMKWGLTSLTPSQIGFLRFGIAFLFLLLIFNRKIVPTKTELGYSILIALPILALTLLYNYGLKTADASVAGFLAGTTIAVVPILNLFFTRKLPKKKVWFSVVIITVGIGFISLTSNFVMERGELLCLLGAIAYGFQIIFCDIAIKKGCRSLTVGVWQLGFTALFAGLVMTGLGETAITLSRLGWVAILGLAFVSSAYGYLAQITAQKNVAPERIGFIYALEPVFCAVLAFFFFGEIMSFREIIGALLILWGIII